MKIIVFILLLVVLGFRSGISQENPSEAPVIKVLTFNILHGATTKGDFDLDAIARVIIDTDPDLVALQEVDYKTNRSKKYDLVTELGWRTKLAPIFGRAMYYDDGEYGEGILSKYSFIATRNVALPFTTGNEPRAALEILTIIPSGDTIAFVGTHLDHLRDEKDRIAQVKKINEVFSKNKYPTILAGDLNAVPGSTPIDILEEIWLPSYNIENPDPTFPSKEPRVKIDYVMFKPNADWKVIDSRVIQDPIASDHCGYLVTLELVKD
jgi:endonuclease/exonuclease/phosphatase family metal-dependent hydrolase